MEIQKQALSHDKLKKSPGVLVCDSLCKEMSSSRACIIRLFGRKDLFLLGQPKMLLGMVRCGKLHGRRRVIQIIALLAITPDGGIRGLPWWWREAQTVQVRVFLRLLKKTLLEMVRCDNSLDRATIIPATRHSILFSINLTPDSGIRGLPWWWRVAKTVQARVFFQGCPEKRSLEQSGIGTVGCLCFKLSFLVLWYTRYSAKQKLECSFQYISINIEKEKKIKVAHARCEYMLWKVKKASQASSC